MRQHQVAQPRPCSKRFVTASCVDCATKDRHRTEHNAGPPNDDLQDTGKTKTVQHRHCGRRASPGGSPHCYLLLAGISQVPSAANLVFIVAGGQALSRGGPWHGRTIADEPVSVPATGVQAASRRRRPLGLPAFETTIAACGISPQSGRRQMIPSRQCCPAVRVNRPQQYCPSREQYHARCAHLDGEHIPERTRRHCGHSLTSLGSRWSSPPVTRIADMSQHARSQTRTSSVRYCSIKRRQLTCALALLQRV